MGGGGCNLIPSSKGCILYFIFFKTLRGAKPRASIIRQASCVIRRITRSLCNISCIQIYNQFLIQPAVERQNSLPDIFLRILRLKPNLVIRRLRAKEGGRTPNNLFFYEVLGPMKRRKYFVRHNIGLQNGYTKNGRDFNMEALFMLS